MAANKHRIAAMQETESQLVKRGYTSKDRRIFDAQCKRDHEERKWRNPPRFTYAKGSIRVVTESREDPIRTVQFLSGGHVLWFVDFPIDVSLDLVFAFIEMI